MSSGVVMHRTILALAALLVVALAGCVGEEPAGEDSPDSDGDTPSPYGGATDETVHGNVPAGFLPDPITGLSHQTQLDPEHAYTVFANDDVLYVGGSPGLRIYDISDPANPSPLATEVLSSNSRDIDLMFHPNGRLYMALANSQEDGIHLFDVTDPTDPALVSKTPKCTHNVSVMPNTTLVYSSFSACHAEDLAAGDNTHMMVVDFADPANPVEHPLEFPRNVETIDGTPREVSAVSCHHITFEPSLDLAYCAGITQTLIFDTTDPVAPLITQVIDWPGNNIHHAAWITHGGDLLIIGDEFAGVLAPTPACTSEGDLPTSALWFYDLSDLSAPTPIGYFEQEHYDAINEDSVLTYAEERDGATDTFYCSTHFGGFVEDQDIFVLGWYTAGTVLLDFSDPTNPFQLGEFRADGKSTTADAIYYKGHVYSADEIRGLDVLKVI